ncbi:MAG: permease [Cellulosilyticaceae bacterium]
MEGFLLIFLSIVLEAIPFVMIGALISSLIHLFISEETITRIMPKNKFLGLIAAGIMGFVFPVCECAIVPIVKRLIKKGVPVDVAITFMLAVPIVNPVVLASTYYAFGNNPNMMILRGAGGLLGAVLIGWIVGRVVKGEEVMKDAPKKAVTKKTARARSLKRPAKEKKRQGLWETTQSIIIHTSRELYSVGRFLIAGAFLSAIMQNFVPREWILSVGNNEISSILVMMFMAFVLSLCSEADAFIARTFASQFTTGSILAFLIMGPMIDIKNTLMLSSGFKTKFIIKLVTIIGIVCFVIAIGVNALGVTL